MRSVILSAGEFVRFTVLNGEQILLKYVGEHGENKPLREMSDYLAETTGVRVTTVTIGRMLKAATEAAEGQGRRKLRAPRKDDTARVAWIAPEAQRATPVIRDNRVAWTLPEQSGSPAVQPQLPGQQSATPPIQEQLAPQQDASPGIEPRPMAPPSLSAAIQPEPTAQPAIQVMGRPHSIAESSSSEASPPESPSNEASPVPMEGVMEQESPNETAEEAGGE